MLLFSISVTVSNEVATAFYHWFFLIQPYPFPETLIGANVEFYLKYMMFRNSRKAWCLRRWKKIRLPSTSGVIVTPATFSCNLRRLPSG